MFMCGGVSWLLFSDMEEGTGVRDEELNRLLTSSDEVFDAGRELEVVG